MYLRKTAKTHKGKTYTNFLLVESQHTPKGPRQRIICSLGSLAPAPREHWLDLAHRLQASLQGQSSFPPGRCSDRNAGQKGPPRTPSACGGMAQRPDRRLSPARDGGRASRGWNGPCGPSSVAAVGTA